MKTEKEEHKIVALAEDVRQIIKTTEKGKMGQLDMMRFSKDHTNPYLLEDKKPVFYNIGQDQLLCIFDFGKNHFFLNPEQCFRLAAYIKLSIYELIALILKSEWEQFIAESQGFLQKTQVDLKSIFQDQKLIDAQLTVFHPDKGRVFKLIQLLPYGKASLKIRSNINLIIDDMIREKNFLFANVLISEFYPEKEFTESLLLKNSPENVVNEFKKLKYLWKRRTTELEEKLLEGEKKKRINLNQEDLYFRTFGKQELEKLGLQQQLLKYRKVLSLKKKNPQLSIREALNKAINYLSAFDQKQRELKRIYMRSLRCLDIAMFGKATSITHDKFTNYKDDVKKLLTKIHFLLHPDTCPFSDLSEKQKKGISELWAELMSSKNELYSYKPGMMLWSLPDIDRLYSILIRACKIFGIPPEDLDVSDRLGLMIKKGMPIKKIIIFLNQDIEKLQLHLTRLEIIQDEYTNADKCRKYMDALEHTEVHLKELDQLLLDLNDQISALKTKISLAFQKDAVNIKKTTDELHFNKTSN